MEFFPFKDYSTLSEEDRQKVIRLVNDLKSGFNDLKIQSPTIEPKPSVPGQPQQEPKPESGSRQVLTAQPEELKTNTDMLLGTTKRLGPEDAARFARNANGQASGLSRSAVVKKAGALEAAVPVIVQRAPMKSTAPPESSGKHVKAPKTLTEKPPENKNVQEVVRSPVASRSNPVGHGLNNPNRASPRSSQYWKVSENRAPKNSAKLSFFDQQVAKNEQLLAAMDNKGGLYSASRSSVSSEDRSPFAVDVPNSPRENPLKPRQTDNLWGLAASMHAQKYDGTV